MEGLTQLREATERLATSQARLWHARALVDLGAALRGAGRDLQAREPLLEGLDLAEGCAAIPLAQTTRAELAASGAEVPRQDSRRDTLTAYERRIAELAADGASNAQIAQQLFVTARNIEDHLSGVYRKLDIRTPHELPGALHR